MEEMSKLLSQLADKLGTTTEYLWGVLIKQAPIDAITTLFQMLLVLLFGIGLWKVHRWLSKSEDDSDCSRYEEYEELAIAPMVIATIVFVILSIVCFFCITDVVNGFLNPEYWALDKILSKVN
jgi:hypothetical protein